MQTGTTSASEWRYDTRRILAVIVLIVSIVVLSAASVFLISSLAEKSYTAEAQLVVIAGLGIDQSGNGDVLTAPRIGQTYATLALTRPVLLDVIARAKLPVDPIGLAHQLRVSADPVSPFISIAATDVSPTQAAQTANALADILVKRATVPPAPGTVVPGTAALTILEVVERAVVPEGPSGPRVMFNTVLAAGLAFVLAMATVAVVTYMWGERRDLDQ